MYPFEFDASNCIIMTWNDSSGNPRLCLRTGSTGNYVKLSTISGSTFTDLATSPTSAITLQAYNIIDCQLTYSTSGTFTLYVNGVSLLTYSGDVTASSGVTTIGQVTFGSCSFNNNTLTCQTFWSELLVATVSTLSAGVLTLAPTGDGVTQSWTPNTVGNINPLVINDSNSVATSTANALSEWTTNSTIPSGIWNVMALVQEARVEVGGSGPQHFEWLLHVGSSDYVQGYVAPITSYANYNASSGSVWSVNPSTGIAWATSDFGSGFNIGIESLA
jgi:hypothetical protein